MLDGDLRTRARAATLPGQHLGMYIILVHGFGQSNNSVGAAMIRQQVSARGRQLAAFVGVFTIYLAYSGALACTCRGAESYHVPALWLLWRDSGQETKPCEQQENER